MNGTPSNPRYGERYGPLAQRMLAGAATAEQTAELERALLDDPALRAWFGDYLEMAALLRWQLAPPVLHLSEEETASPPIETSPEKLPVVHEPALAELPAGRWPRLKTAARRYLAQPGVLAVLVATLVTGSIVLTMAALTLPPIQVPPPAPPLVATLVDAADCRWRGEPPPVDLARGERLELLAGVAEIRFDNAARVWLQGPAVFTLDSAEAGYLERGRLVAVAPSGSSGFTMQTPLARVVDLGTEFGLSAGVGDTEIHMFHGKAEVTPLDPRGDNLPAVLLRTGQAYRVSLPADGLSGGSIPLATRGFVGLGTQREPLGAIGIDFQRTEQPNAGVPLDPRQYAGLIPHAHWNLGDSALPGLGGEGLPPVVDSEGVRLPGVRVRWNSDNRGHTAPTSRGGHGDLMGDHITGNRNQANPHRALEVQFSGLPPQLTGGGFDLICYQNVRDDASQFDAPHTFRLDLEDNGRIDAEQVLSSTSQREFRLRTNLSTTYEGFHVRFEVPAGIDTLRLVVDVPPGKLATLSGVQLVPRGVAPRGLPSEGPPSAESKSPEE